MKTNTNFFYSLFLTCLLTATGQSLAANAPAASQPVTEEKAPTVTGMTGSYLSSQFARENGNIDDAIGSLQRVHKENPENLDVARQLQGMLLLQGKIDDAIVVAQDIRQSNNSDSKDALADLLVILHEVKNNAPDHASALLDAASENGSPQLWEPLLAGWLDLDQKKITKPLKIEELSADVGNARPLVSYHLALINARAGFKDAAAVNFKNSIETPQDPPMRIMGQLLKFYKENNQPSQLKSLVESYRKHHPDAVDPEVTPIITAQDGIAEVLYTMGGIMIGAGATNDAAIYLQLVLYVKPELAEAALVLGDVYNDMQQYDRSNEFYARVVPASPLYKQAQMHIAINYERAEKLGDALSLLDKLAVQLPNDPDVLVTKGDLQRIHAKYKDAVESYTQALALIPELKSIYWPVLFARGACYERLAQWPDAEADLRQALDLKPDQPDVLNYLGYGLLERNKNVDEARKMIELAVKQRPDDAQIVDSMGWALYMQGDYAKATPYLEKAVELLPADPTVNDHLGDSYWRVGRKTEARFQWERSLTYSPDGKLAETINKKLKDGLPTAMADTGHPVSSATP